MIIALITLQAVLAGTESALSAVKRSQLRELDVANAAAGRAAHRLREDPRSYIAFVQISLTILSCIAGALGALHISVHLADTMVKYAPWAAAFAESASVILAVVAVTVACVFLGRLLPSHVGVHSPVSCIALFGRPLLFVSAWVRPVTKALTIGVHVSDHGGEEPLVEAARGPTELQELVDEAQKSGAVHPQAAEIAMRALGFGELSVADVMVPRTRIHAIAVNASNDEIRRILLEEGHSCMPVYEGTLDQIVGILVAKDVLALAWERELIVLQDLLQPPYFAPEIMRAADLLHELQHRRMHFAIAVDELGGTAGIVTVEDLLEELVGDIRGEHDAEAPDPIRRESDGSALVQGTVPIRDVNRALHLDLAEGDTWSTVGGLCVSLAGRIPETGNRLSCGAGVTLEIIEASARRVRSVRLRRNLPSAATTPAATA